jgi:hypothetical protein
MNKNLYKATFNAVIHCEDEKEAVRIARELCNEETFVCYEVGSVKEIVDEDEIPCGWEESFCPINDQGSYDMETIGHILKRNEATYALRKRIEELESELEQLKSQLK